MCYDSAKLFSFGDPLLALELESLLQTDDLDETDELPEASPDCPSDASEPESFDSASDSNLSAVNDLFSETVLTVFLVVSDFSDDNFKAQSGDTTTGPTLGEKLDTPGPFAIAIMSSGTADVEPF